MSQKDYDMSPRWYVVHTYSGYENKVKTDLEKTVKNRELEDYFFDIVVPMEEQIEIKDGKRKANLKKVFPGYVLVKMIVTEETWYIVRNTRGVTGFVGSGTDPIPLTDDEIRAMGFEDASITVDYDIDDSVQILNGPFKDSIGTVKEINKEKHKVKVLISMFGRETPVELEFSQVKITKEELLNKMKEKYPDCEIDFSQTDCIKIQEYTTSGRVKTIKIGNKEIAGTEARTILGLKSTNFSVVIEGEEIIFSVTGYGHGVGMSQTGADSMAKTGANYETIIKHFYTGVEIIELKFL